MVEHTIAVIIGLAIQLFAWWSSGRLYEKSYSYTRTNNDLHDMYYLIWVISYTIRILFVVLFIAFGGKFSYIGWMWLAIILVKNIYISEKSEKEMLHNKWGRMFLRLHGVSIRRLVREGAHK